jgi:serine phosphatase RsbU (regulator of sigma subunit)
LELARSYQQIKRQKNILEKRNRDFMDSVIYARRIQEAILPDKESFGRRLGGAFIYIQPRDVVSGDFFWYFDKRKEVIAACADCTGHGVPGAFMSILGSNLLGAIIRDFGILKPNLLLSELNERMMATLQKNVMLEEYSIEPTLDGMDIAVVHIDLSTCKVEFSGAHRPLIYFKSGQMHEIRGTNCSIGGVTAFKRLDFENHEIELSPGDTLYMYSDGITDQFSSDSHKKFGSARLKKMLVDIQPLSMEEQQKAVARAMAEWRGTRDMQDDQTLIGLKL